MLGLIATALAGGANAVGDAAMKTHEQQIQLQREQALLEIKQQGDIALTQAHAGAEQETHAVNAQTDIGNIPAKGAAETQVDVARRAAIEPDIIAAERRKVEQQKEVEAAKPVAAGSTVRGQNGAADWTAPVKLTPEQRDYWEQRADYYRQAAAAGPKAGKEATPKIIPMKDSEGNVIGMIDENSGAVGTPVPGQPATPAVWHAFSPNEPGKPAAPPDLAWTLHGKPLARGIEDLYPAISKRQSGAAGNAGQPAGPQTTIGKDGITGTTENGAPFTMTTDAVQAASTDPAKRAAMEKAIGPVHTEQILSDWAKSKDKPNLGIIGARAAQADTKATALAEPGKVPDTAAPKVAADPGAKVDQAKADYKSASNKLQSYGAIQRRKDPAGYAKAKQDADSAKVVFDAAMSDYQKSLGSVTAATGRTF